MMKFAKKFSTLLVFILCLSVVTMVSAAEGNNVNLISVDGQGHAVAQPDKAVLTVGVTNFAKDANEAQNANAQAMAAVLNALKAAGIADKDMETKNYNFYPSTDMEENNRITGYTVNNSLVVTLKDVTKVGEVIDLALDNGANKVHSLTFGLQKPEAVRKAALQNAIADAKLKADIIAETLGVKITGIKLVTESVGSLFDNDATPMLLSSRAKANQAATPITAGEVELQANVHIEYIIP